MLEIYWGCLIFGVIFAMVTFLFGDVLYSAAGISPGLSFDHLAWLQPMVLVGGITSFGGSGVLLTTYTTLTGSETIALALLAAILLSALVYFIYIKPMQKCENSAGFFTADLMGKAGEVILAIPAGGFGEVLIRVGAGNTNQTAASYDQVDLLAGTQVVVAEIKEGVLYVRRNNKQDGGETV